MGGGHICCPRPGAGGQVGWPSPAICDYIPWVLCLYIRHFIQPHPASGTSGQQQRVRLHAGLRRRGLDRGIIPRCGHGPRSPPSAGSHFRHLALVPPSRRISTGAATTSPHANTSHLPHTAKECLVLHPGPCCFVAGGWEGGFGFGGPLMLQSAFGLTAQAFVAERYCIARRFPKPL